MLRDGVGVERLREGETDGWRDDVAGGLGNKPKQLYSAKTEIQVSCSIRIMLIE